MPDHNSTPAPFSPSPQRPLLGLTILTVEDSLYSCEALRLMCQRSGARLRRADCLASARRHLQVYRPSVMIIDIGLPDGSGLDLIGEMHRASPRIPIILGTSGDPSARISAQAAGADGFLCKPVASLATFQQTILCHMPADCLPVFPRILQDEVLRPDMAAFHDDIAQIADHLHDERTEERLGYTLQFLGTVARDVGDTALASASHDVARARADGRPTSAGLARLAGMVQERLENRVAI